MDALAPTGIRQAHHCDLIHRRMLGQHIFDLGGEDIVAASLDPKLGAVAQIDVATLIAPSHVAGMDPAIADGLPVLFRSVPVAGERNLAADDQFAGLSVRNIAAIVIDDAHVNERQWLAG